MTALSKSIYILPAKERLYRADHNAKHCKAEDSILNPSPGEMKNGHVFEGRWRFGWLGSWFRILFWLNIENRLGVDSELDRIKLWGGRR